MSQFKTGNWQCAGSAINFAFGFTYFYSGLAGFNRWKKNMYMRGRLLLLISVFVFLFVGKAFSQTVEICNDGKDNNGDGKIDCLDSQCIFPVTVEKGCRCFDGADNDGDGMNNWQEWRSDTVPTNVLSALRMLSPTVGVSGVTVSWDAVSTRIYSVERSTNLAIHPAFGAIATNIAGQSGIMTYTDTNAVGNGLFFYRVGVRD